MNIGIAFGFTGLTIVTWALILFLWKLKNSKNETSLIVLYTLFCIVISSSFHNSGIFNSTLPCFVIVIGITSLISKSNNQVITQQRN